jgi:hypothetical protein
VIDERLEQSPIRQAAAVLPKNGTVELLDDSGNVAGGHVLASGLDGRP